MDKSMRKKLIIPVTLGAGATSFLTVKLGLNGFIIGMCIALLTGLIFRLIYGKAS